MKQYKFIQKLLLAVLALGCASCSQDEETQVNQQNLVVLNVTDTGLVSSESQTRTVDDGFVTTFTQGDQLGLFAVKDGVIMDEINNTSKYSTKNKQMIDIDIITHSFKKRNANFTTAVH